VQYGAVRCGTVRYNAVRATRTSRCQGRAAQCMRASWSGVERGKVVYLGVMMCRPCCTRAPLVQWMSYSVLCSVQAGQGRERRISWVDGTESRGTSLLGSVFAPRAGSALLCLPACLSVLSFCLLGSDLICFALLLLLLLLCSVLTYANGASSCAGKRVWAGWRICRGTFGRRHCTCNLKRPWG
jgi:hypothetical protein